MKMYKYFVNALMASSFLIVFAPAQGSFKDLCIDYGIKAKAADVATMAISAVGLVRDRWNNLDPLIQKTCLHIGSGVVAWYAFTKGIGSLVYAPYRNKSEYEHLQLTPEKKEVIKMRIHQERSINALRIIEMEQEDIEAHEIAKMFAFKNDAVLALSPRFFELEEYVQKGVIAHEAVHYGKNHTAKSVGIRQALLLGIPSGFIHLAPSSFYKAIAFMGLVGVWYKEASYRSWRDEREADLHNKTPEELLGIIASRFAQAECVEDRDPKKYIRLFDMHLCQVDGLSAQDHTIMIVLIKQYCQQVKDPKGRDIPSTTSECQDALSCYLLPEEVAEHLRNNKKVEVVGNRMDSTIAVRRAFLIDRLRVLTATS